VVLARPRSRIPDVVCFGNTRHAIAFDAPAHRGESPDPQNLGYQGLDCNDVSNTRIGSGNWKIDLWKKGTVQNFVGANFG
jgi:hypothetical protein